MHSHMTAGNSPSMCSHFGIVHHVRDTGFWGVSEGARIDSFQQISENTRQKGEFSSFWQSFLPPTQMSIQTKDFPPPQISSDTEFVLSDNTHCHSNKQWWPKHRIMWLHLESSRILTRILIANTFHFCGTSLQRISESFTHSIPNLQLGKWRKEERPILRSRQEAGLRVLRREEGEWPRPGLLDCKQHMELLRSCFPPSKRADLLVITCPPGWFLSPHYVLSFWTNTEGLPGSKIAFLGPNAFC